MVHSLAAPRIQLRPHTFGREPPPALGPEASGRSRLEVRINGATIMSAPLNATALTLPAQELAWKPPSRGRVGMYSLIAAESAIFTIFVVAYLFYIGKSVSGPTPADVLELPIFSTICLLSSSLTIHLAVRALRQAKVGAFGLWWFLTLTLGAIFLVSTGLEWRHLIY